MIIIARKYGQLGNRLFLYAHLIAAARHYGVELRNPCFSEYARLFPSTRCDLWCRYDVHTTEKKHGSVPTDHEPSMLHRNALMHSVHTIAKSLDLIGLRRHPANVIRLRSGEQCDLEGERFRSAIESGRTLLLQGWLFRSGRLLHEHWPHIRDFFAVSACDQEAITGAIDEARRESDVVVGVHIRRGDYAKFQGGRYFYDDAHYANWMHQVREQYPGRRVQFLICSHEQLDENQFVGLNLTRGPGSALQDMYALAETDWMMGPPSTFSSWASFVGKRPYLALDSADQKPLVPQANSELAAA